MQTYKQCLFFSFAQKESLPINRSDESDTYCG